MNEKMQLLFAHIACVALIVACFWLSQTVLKDQPHLGQIVIGAGLFLWGKVGFRPSEAVVDLILEHLSPKQVRKVKSIHPPAPAEVAAPPAIADAAGRRCAACLALLSPYNTGTMCDGCRLVGGAA